SSEGVRLMYADTDTSAKQPAASQVDANHESPGEELEYWQLGCTDGAHQSVGQPPQTWYGHCKVVLEFLAAAVLLVIAAPVIFLTGILVKLTSRGPVFYTQTRLCKNGRPFLLHKIRTMWYECERESGPRWATAADPRITPVGRFLRRTHLDELP